MAQSAAPHAHMNATQWVLITFLSTLWGASFFFYKMLVPALPPFTVVLGRVTIASAVLGALVWMRGETLRYPARTWVSLGVLGLINNAVPFYLIAYGEIHVSSGVAAILNATTPLFTAVVAHVFARSDQLTWMKLIGVGFGLAGVGVLIGQDALSGFGGGDVIGELACLMGAVFYGFGGVYASRFNAMPPLHVATGQMVTSTVILLPSVLIDRPWTLSNPSLEIWASLFGLALASTALAFVIYFHLLGRAGATNVSLVTFLVPVSALILGSVVLGEELASSAVAGMIVIALGLIFIDGRLLRRFHAKAASMSS